MITLVNQANEVRAGISPLFPRLWRYCLVLTSNHDRANDLAQAACLRAIEKADQFVSGTTLDRWLFRIAQRIWFNQLRSEAVRRGNGLSTIDEIEISDPSSDPETNIYARQVLSSVMGLPEAQRLTVLLVYLEGYSYQEAADMLEIPIGTVMSRLSAARTKLSGGTMTKKLNRG